MSEPTIVEAWLEDTSGLRLDLTENFTIGRAVHNTFSLRGLDQEVSAYHARIERDPRGRYVLEDRASTNGTFINGCKITRHVLRDGDRLKFGSRQLVFRQPVHPAEPGTATRQRTQRHYEEHDCWFVIGDICRSTALAQEMGGPAWAGLASEWAAECLSVVERHRGNMVAHRGDGWLLLWIDATGVAESVVGALGELREMQRRANPAFRMVLDRGRATLTGSVLPGGENICGAEVHRAFRMEKVAGEMREDLIASEPVAQSLGPWLAFDLLPGEFTLPSFTGTFRFYRIR